MVFTGLDVTISDEMSPSVSSMHVAPASVYVAPRATDTEDEPASVITGSVVSADIVTVYS